MKISNKILFFILLIFMSSASVVFAMPSDTVVMGDRAYNMQVLSDMSDELQSEIGEAIVNTDAIYYNVDGVTDGFLNADGDVPMTNADKAALNNIILTKADGTKEQFSKFTDENGLPVGDSNAEQVYDMNYNIEILPGLVFTQRLVKISLDTDHDTDYRVVMFGKKLEYNADIDKFVGVVNSSDENDIKNAVVIMILIDN